MLSKSKRKFINNENYKFIQGDMEHTNFLPQDLIITNFALQWLDNLEKTIKKLYYNSNIFAFSSLINGTFIEWQDILHSHGVKSITESYPTKIILEKFLLSLSPNKYYFEEREFTMEFSNLYCFLKYLKQLGASSNNSSLPLHKLKYIIETYDNKFTVSYKVFFGLIKRI